MHPRDPSEPLHLSVARGGRLVCAPAADAAQRAHLCNAAWGLSMAFDCGRVQVWDYLPGLHLDIQAQRLPEPLPPGPLPQPRPARQVWLGWERMERTLWDALHGPWTSEAIMVSDEEVRCVIWQHGTLPDVGAPIAFTLLCAWPGALGGRSGAVVRTRM